MSQLRLATLLILLVAACGAQQNATQKDETIAALKLELDADRKLLQETRAELQTLMVELKPLLEMVKVLKVDPMTMVDGLDDQGGSTRPIAEAAVQDKDEAEMQRLLDAGIKELGTNRYRLSRSLLDAWIENPTRLARSARLVPYIKDAKAVGIKVYAIRPSSILDRIGLKNGDILTHVNGHEFTSPDNALEVYSKIRRVSWLRLDIVRFGKAVVVTVKIK